MVTKFSSIMFLVAVVFHFPAVAACEDFIQEKKELAAYEKQMAERPLEALNIARRASALFADQEKHLYEMAAKNQENHLLELSLGQAIELAEVLEKKLQDPAEASHVRSSWLAARGLGLSQDDVRRFLGLPQKISFQILYSRQLELWKYEGPARLLLTFVCTKNQHPALRSVRSVSESVK
jgi:hypothetical protein